MTIPRGHIECPAKGCRQGLFDLSPPQSFSDVMAQQERGGVRVYSSVQCRACNGLGYISDPTLRKVVTAFIGPETNRWQGLCFAVLDDGSLVFESFGTFPGTLAHREAEDG